MKKIKVIHILPMLAPGGAERVAVHIARGLNPRRFDVAVISIWRRQGCELDKLLDDCGIPVAYLGKGQGFDGRVYQRLHQALKRHRPDIVHTHLHVLRYTLPSLLFLKPASAVHTVHNLAEREIEPRARCLQRFAIHHGVVPIAVSKEVARSLRQLYGIQDCRVIANGVPTNVYRYPRVCRSEWRAREGFRDDHVLFVCVARLEEQKNHALLINAFAQGPASDPNAQLVLVGEGLLRDRLRDQAESLGLAQRIHFLGLRTDIPDVLSAMDVFVLASNWEGNPLCVMEAMAAGLPIVSTAVGGVPDLFTHGREGLLVRPGSEQGLSRGLNSLLLNPELRHSLGIAATRRAKECFDVSRMVYEYEDLYETQMERARCISPRSLPGQPDISLREA
jgi:glycosyltransferase involved in cell wall biosynthesis